MPVDSFSKQLERYREAIDLELQALVQTEKPDYLYEPLRYIFKGKGKRLRPILVFLVAKMYEKSEKSAMPAALAVEILHNFSLVHDDIMDHDETRHGLPTVYRKWDEATAILAGDALFAMAYAELAKLNGLGLGCMRVFNETARKLCEGQALDKEFESCERVTIEEYMHMVELKTGALLALCCQLGAVVGNATESEQNSLGKFGIKVGQAFQIQDDLLEIYSTSNEMGKSLGSDVVGSKKTYLICKSLTKDEAGWKSLMKSFEGSDLESVIFPALRKYFQEEGVVDQANSEVHTLITEAKSLLGGIPREKQNLIEFLDWLMERKK